MKGKRPEYFVGLSNSNNNEKSNAFYCHQYSARRQTYIKVITPRTALLPTILSIPSSL